MSALRLEAPAKINLSLRIVGRRQDGHHLLDSEVVLLELADQLTLEPEGSVLRVTGDGHDALPEGKANLAWRGLLAGSAGRTPTGSLHLEKRIPAAAGLGGGSSDAAAAWRLARVRHGSGEVPAPDDVEELARIGADVPFFAALVAAARVTGVGEGVEATPADRRTVVLIHPPFGLSTAAVFAELVPADWGRSENDLLAPARRLRPELDDLFALVERAGGEPRLTGSGPTIFCIVEGPPQAAALAARLADAGARATITHTRTGPTAIQTLDMTDEEDVP